VQVSSETGTRQPPRETATSHQGEGDPVTGNRRAYPRLRPEEVDALEAARLASGAEIKLIDLSRGGAQFETDRRFLPNSTVSLRLVTRDAAFVVNGRVVRSRIVRLERGGLGYNVAVAFNELLQNVIGDGPASHPVAAEPNRSAEAEAPAEPATESLRDTTGPRDSDISQEEADAFEANATHMPAMLTVTAAVTHSSEELLDMFNGNNW
jgi:hypothetical protein